MEKHSFPPVINEDTETIILGTIPGEVSLRTGEYYANKSNQFWKIIFKILNDGIPINGYELKKQLLLDNNIGLWDVLKTAERTGSLDENIEKEEINDFESFFKSYPKIKKVIFNGQNAASYFGKYKFMNQGSKYFVLPSTSSANTWKSLDDKYLEWRKVLI